MRRRMCYAGDVEIYTGQLLVSEVVACQDMHNDEPALCATTFSCFYPLHSQSQENRWRFSMVLAIHTSSPVMHHKDKERQAHNSPRYQYIQRCSNI